jgi:hypothetical protein
MVGKTGFEPATPWSQAKYSTKLSYFPNNSHLQSIRIDPLLQSSSVDEPGITKCTSIPCEADRDGMACPERFELPTF